MFIIFSISLVFIIFSISKSDVANDVIKWSALLDFRHFENTLARPLILNDWSIQHLVFATTMRSTIILYLIVQKVYLWLFMCLFIELQQLHCLSLQTIFRNGNL